VTLTISQLDHFSIQTCVYTPEASEEACHHLLHMHVIDTEELTAQRMQVTNLLLTARAALVRFMRASTGDEFMG
jgi:hypothetical protein